MNEKERELWNSSEIENIFKTDKNIIKPDVYDEITGIPIQSYYYAGFDGWVKVYSDNSATLSGKNRLLEYFDNKQKAFEKAKLLNDHTKSVDKIFKRNKKSSNPKKRKSCSCKKK